MKIFDIKKVIGFASTVHYIPHNVRSSGEIEETDGGDNVKHAVIKVWRIYTPTIE